MNYSNTPDSQNMRIDSRILKHLLHEASELLDEAQTHALVEKQCDATLSILAQANWRMTATCIWAISELFPTSDHEDQAAQLHAPVPIFSRATGSVSPQFEGFIQRVGRLHERARRLDELSRVPTISSAPDAEANVSSSNGIRESAAVISLFAEQSDTGISSNPVEQARSQVRWVMGGRD